MSDVVQFWGGPRDGDSATFADGMVEKFVMVPATRSGFGRERYFYRRPPDGDPHPWVFIYDHTEDGPG